MRNGELILSDISPRDFHATYADTYLQFKSRDDDGWYVGRVSNIETDDGSLAISVDKVNGDRVLLYSDDPSNDINFDWPKLGFINSNKHTMYVERVARRQWKKGFRWSNVEHKILDKKIIRHLVVNDNINYRLDIGNNEISELFNPTYTPFEEAFETVVSGEMISRAISPHFAFSSMYDVEHPVLSYKGRPIGVIKDGRIEVSCKVDHLIPMIMRIVPNGFHNSISIQS